MLKKISLLLFFVCFSFGVWSSSFKNLTTLDGLSQNDVNCIFQDSRGFIWIGTHDGLNRYDGYTFKVYRMEPRQKDGLVSNIVFTITEDAEGHLWMGSSDNGICKFDVDNNVFTHFSNSTETPNVLTSNRIIQIKADSYGNVWSVTDKGVDVIITATNEVIHLTLADLGATKGSFQGNFGRSILEDSEGNIWIGTYKGLAKMDPVKHKVSYIYTPSAKPSLVTNIQEYGDYLVVCNGATVRIFDKKTKEYHKSLKLLRSTRMLIDDSGKLWVGSANGLLLCELEEDAPLRFKKKKLFTASTKSDGLTTNYITALFKDKSGLIWIGTNGGGVNIYNPKYKPFKQYNIQQDQTTTSYNKVRSVFSDKRNNLWVGTAEGLSFISKSILEEQSDNKNIDQQKLKGNLVYCIDEDEQNDLLWMGAIYPSEVYVYNTKNNQNIDPYKLGVPKTKSVFSILVDSKSNVWLGTYGDGLWRLKRKKDGTYYRRQFVMEDKSYSLSSNIIRSLMEDKHGNIWVGTSNGLNKISYKESHTRNPRFFVHKNIRDNEKTLSHNYILPIYESKSGDIWVGTMGGGLNKYVISDIGVESFESITTKDGLPNNVIKGIQEDENQNLWLSSNKGLTCYNPITKEIRNYDVADGLQDNEFSELASCKNKKGELIFGGVNGLSVFKPSDIAEDTTVAELAFTRLDILNQPIEVGEEVRGRVPLQKDINATEQISLKYEENSFTMYFAGLHFVAPHKNKYKYILEGFDSEWVYTNSDARFAKYTNLKPGNYTLKVMATNNDGLWSNEARTISITVIAPWWMSTSAMVAYLVVFVLLLWFFRRFSLIGVQQKSQLLMERFEKEKVQELSQMKLKFFTNISHEFRTPLTLILGPIEKLIKEKNTLPEEKVDKIHHTIYRNTNVLLRLINQLMDFRKYEQGKMKIEANETNIVLFVKDVSKAFEMVADEKNIQFKFNTTSESIKLWFDPDKLEKIIYNLLSNAFKYTDNGGEISINIKEEDKTISIEVNDTGIGMSNNVLKHVFDRFYNAGKISTNKQGSTGIGLSYSKSLVEMHHGTISAKSTEGEGTSFVVELLKGKQHLKKEELRGTSTYKIQEDVILSGIIHGEQKKAVVAVSSDNKIKLLVVEDNFELREYVVDNLESKYEVLQAKNGKEGLEICKEYNPDLIVSDVMMPIMDGFEMCEAIKADESISHIPIILLTAKNLSEHKVKGYSLGADAYVSKPFDMDVLLAQIDAIIEKRSLIINTFDKKIEVTPTDIASTSMDEKFLAKIISIIESKIDEPLFTVEELASEYGISKVIMNRKLKALTGKTAKIFIRTIRLKRAAQLLSLGRYTVAEVTYEVGFSDLKYFRTCFKTEFSLSPSEYKKKFSEQLISDSDDLEDEE